MLETVDRPIPTTPARAYAMKARGDQDAPEVITSIFSLFDIEMHTLIDPGSTHSYVCIEHVFDKIPVVEQLAYDMHVTSSLIPGMDWLSKHRAMVDCGQKTVVLRCSDQTEVIVQGIGSSAMSNVISSM